MSLNAVSLVNNTQLPAAVAAQYTCPTNSKIIIRHVVFTNTDSSSHTVTAHIVPNGGGVSNATMVMSVQAIAGNNAYVSSELSGLVLNAGDSLQCFADTAAKITLNASGIQQT